MAKILTCTICNSSLFEHPVTFVQEGKLWTVNVLLCKNEKCLVKRGGFFREHRVEMRAARK